MITHYFNNVYESYQFSLKLEWKIDRKLKLKFKGKGQRGRCMASVTRVNENDDESNSSQSNIGDWNSRGRGFRRGKSKYVITCYWCGVEGQKET